MIDFSIVDKIKTLFNIILSSPFFLVSFIVGIILLILMVIDIKRNKKINKIIYIVAWVFVIGFIVIRYWNWIIQIFDNLVNNFFMALYFPNIAVYTSVILIVNGVFFYTLFNKKMKSIYKIYNIIISAIIDFFLILIIEEIVSNNIDIYASLTVYSNPKLLILLELTTGIFMSWILLILFTRIVYKIKKIDRDIEFNEEIRISVDYQRQFKEKNINNKTFIKEENQSFMNGFPKSDKVIVRGVLKFKNDNYEMVINEVEESNKQLEPIIFS